MNCCKNCKVTKSVDLKDSIEVKIVKNLLKLTEETLRELYYKAERDKNEPIARLTFTVLDQVQKAKHAIRQEIH